MDVVDIKVGMRYLSKYSSRVRQIEMIGGKFKFLEDGTKYVYKPVHCTYNYVGEACLEKLIQAEKEGIVKFISEEHYSLSAATVWIHYYGDR